MALVRRKTQTASSKIWTLVANSISSDKNRYVKHASYSKCNNNETEVELNIPYASWILKKN